MISLVRGLSCPAVRIVPRLQLVRRCQSRTNVPGYTPLLDMVRVRQEEARRSVLVQVAGHESASDLTAYCQDNFGEVESLHYYNNSVNKTFTHFLIVQFRDVSSVETVLRSAQHSGGDGSVAAVPVYSPFLWLQGAQSGKSHQQSNSRRVPVPVNFGSGDKESLEQMVSWTSQ